MQELLIAMAVLGALAFMSVAMFRTATAKAHQAACLNVLRGLGVAMEGYLGDHQGRYPDLQMGRSSAGGDREVLEVALLDYAGSKTAFRCPADGEHFEKSGSSYFWNDNQSGLRYDQLGFLGVEADSLPLIYDKEAFHGDKDGTNFLYANQSVNRNLDFNVGSK